MTIFVSRSTASLTMAAPLAGLQEVRLNGPRFCPRTAAPFPARFGLLDRGRLIPHQLAGFTLYSMTYKSKTSAFLFCSSYTPT